MSSITYRAVRNAILFLVFGLAWIFFSDQIAESIVDVEQLTFIQTIKGFSFVIITSIFIYFLVFREIKKEKKLFNELEIKNEELLGLTEKNETTNDLLQKTISKLEKSYNAVEESQLKYTTFISNSNEGIYRFYFEKPLDINLEEDELIEKIYNESRLDEFNPVFLQMYGYENSPEFMGMSLLEFHTHGNRRSNKGILKQFVGSNFTFLNLETIEYNTLGEEKIFNNNAVGIIEDGHLTMIWGTQSDITDNKKREFELIEAKQKAEENDKLKSAFLANMSHEIRTPLNGIIGFSEMLDDDHLTKPERQKFVNIIHNNSNQLLRIISDILDISKIETEQLLIQKKPLSLNALVEEVGIHLETAMIKGNKKINVILEKALEQDEDWIISDKQRLFQVITNLANNALKFTKEGDITIGYELINKNLRMFVKDTGIGIPADKQAIVFDRFSQIEGYSNRKHGGAGLGLSISKGIVELLDGTISFTSKQNEGSEFYFIIPLLRP